MITEEDYLSYLSEIDIMEKNMRDIYQLVINEVKDPDVKSVLESLYKAEKRHQELTTELREIMIEKIIKSP